MYVYVCIELTRTLFKKRSVLSLGRHSTFPGELMGHTSHLDIGEKENNCMKVCNRVKTVFESQKLSLSPALLHRNMHTINPLVYVITHSSSCE